MAQSKEVFNLEYRFGGNAEFLTRIEQSLSRLDKSFTATKVESTKLGDSMEKSMAKASKSTKALEKDTERLGNSFSSLAGKVKGFVAAYAGIAGISKAVSFGMGSMALADVQNRTEKQLQLVMDNMGTGRFFDSIKKEAAAIQGRTIYGDEAMIAGAGELATYVKDPAAMKRMMNVLADYAAGMTGGGEVGAQQMVQLATGLGMAFDGNYRALRMKGFDTSALEKLEKRGKATDAERVDALAKSLSTWNGLSAKMAEDPSAAAIKFRNRLGDLREELGMRLYPVYNKMIAALDKNLPNIERMMDSVGKVSGRMFDAVSNNVDSVMKFGQGVGRLAENVVKLVDVGAPVVGKLMEIPGLVEALMAAMAVEKLDGISGGLGRVAGGFHGIEKALRRTNRELLVMGRNGKTAAMGLAAVAGGGMAGYMGGAQSAGGVIAGGLATGASTIAMTGNPFLALAATGGSFIGSTANAFSKWIGSGKDEAARNRAIEEQGEYNMMLVSSYRNLEKAKKNRQKDKAYYSLSLQAFQDSMAKYSAKYGEDAAMSLYEGISGTASKDAMSSTTNNYVTNNNTVTQNNTIGAEFSKLGSLINQKLVDLMERNLSFDASMVMEVAGA